MNEKQINQKVKEFYPSFPFEEHNLILNLNSLAFSIREKNEFSTKEAMTFFDFVNSFNGESKQTLDIIEIGILEILTDTKTLQKVSFELLRGDLLERYEKLFDDKFVKLID